MKTRTLPLVALAALLASAPARADDTEDMCIASSLEGQVLQRAGRLERARARFAECARPECAAARTAGPCASWEAAVTPRIPRLEVRVVDDLGAPLPAAEVLLDGATLAARATSVDPGHHVVRASFAGRTAQQELDVKEGATPVVVLRVDLARRVPERPTPTWVLLSGGLALAGFATAGVLGATTLATERDLEGCRPWCDPSRRSDLTTPAIGADVALGVGIVATAAAVVGYLIRPTRERVERVTAEGAR